MKYNKPNRINGAWAKASELGDVTEAKIVSETIAQESTFLNKDGSKKMQDVAKVQFKGRAEAMNVNLNKATLAGLIDAFGEESKDWQGHVLKVETEKMRVAGKAVTALYLIPDGYHKIDDEAGYAQIIKVGSEAEPVVQLDDEPEDMPPF